MPQTSDPWQDAKRVIGDACLTLGPQASDQFLNAPEHLAMVLARYRAAAALIGGAESVLEVGCGEGIGAGILTFGWPSITALVLLLFIAGWAIAIGVFQIIGAIRLRKEIDNEWLLIIGGILSVLFGMGVLLVPGAGALALVWVIAAYAIVEGMLFVALAFRLKNEKFRVPDAVHRAAVHREAMHR